MPTNSAAALGQAAGELFEKSVLDILSTTVQERGYTVKSDKLRDAHDTPYSIDAVIYDDKTRPIILIDTKYIRYKKHNRDKASWVCTAHSLLRKHHKTLRKSIVVLGGQWSQPLILFEHDSLQEALTGLLALFPPSVDASQLTSTD